jgi:peptide/nickel transport system permease protein
MRRLVFPGRPGGGRIILGGTLVLLLAVTALTGSRWTRFAPEDMDFDHQLTPPPGWLLWITTTAEGRRALIQSRQGSLPVSVQESEIREDELLMALEGRETDPSGDSRAAPGPAAPGVHAHALGTDRNGRDMVALLVAGARNCFLPGLAACAVALGFGIPLGLLAGYYEGRWRRLAQIFNGTLLSVPRMALILVAICALRPDVYITMMVLGVTLIPRVSELIATRVRILSRMGFILAAREGGIGDFRILTRHLFWYQNRTVFFIQFSLIMAESIMTETTLSYLQFGTRPPDVSWGNIIEGSRLTFFSGQYWITFFPAMAIIMSILGFFSLGDGLNARLAYREGR